MDWTFYSRLNVRTLTISLWLPHLCIIGNAVGFNKEAKDVNIDYSGCQIISKDFREMQVVRHAKYVGNMIGPDGHIHRWTAPRKIIQRVLKISAYTKNLVERLGDLKVYSVSVLSYIRSICALDKATLRAKAHALLCATAGPYNALPTSILGVDSVCGFGPGLVGIHSISLASRYRTVCVFEHAQPRS